MTRYGRLVLMAALIAFLAACVPAAQDDDKPDVAVINAPTESRVEGLAGELERLLTERYGPLPYDFITGRLIRFQETHREMHGERAPLQAAFISRALGGELSVLIGAPLYEREISIVEDAFREQRKVETTVQLEAFIVEPENAEVLGSFTSGVYHTVRLEPVDTPLPEPEDDPDLQAAEERGLEDIAGPLGARLEGLLER